MTSAQYNYINAKISAPLNSEFVYRAEQEIFLGWQIVNYKKEPDISHYTFLQTLKQNIIIKFLIK